MRRVCLACLVLLASCATTPPVDPLDPATLSDLSDRTLDAQWRWAHETERSDADVAGWESLEAYRRALRQEAIRRHPDWAPGFAQAIRSGRLVHDMTEAQVRWAVGPPSGTLDYAFGGSQLTKWVGPPRGLNAAWVVIFKDGVVIEIKDRR